jgi:DNA-binding transcriptional LysR family regulator
MHERIVFAWDDARFFLAIHRSRTLSAAARTLGVNQSTVGRRLDALEEELGVRVFLRTRDGYVIAPAGEQLLPRAERMEDEATAIARELAGRQEKLTGLVRVTTGDAFGPHVVVPILTRFHALHPDIRLEIDADNRLVSLTKREADISVRFAKPKDRGLAVRRLADFAYAPYCATSYAAARGRPTPPFEGHDFVGDPIETRPEARWVAQHSAKGRIVMRSASATVCRAGAVAGLGITLLPCYLGDEEPSLVRLAPPDPGVKYGIWLVVHEDLQHAARIRACADFLAEAIHTDAPRFAGQKRPRSGPRVSRAS